MEKRNSLIRHGVETLHTPDEAAAVVAPADVELSVEGCGAEATALGQHWGYMQPALRRGVVPLNLWGTFFGYFKL